MYKKVIALAMVICLCLSLAVSCKPNNKLPSTSDGASSSQTTSDTASSDSIDTSGWGDETSGIVRPYFLSADQNGDIFYCAASGGIYKQLFESNKLSKVYSDNGYTFTSVETISTSQICVGYKKEEKSGYIIFDLDKKNISNAVADITFADKNIYSLCHFGGNRYFMADPDRYGRFYLYKQAADGQAALAIARGVNEFFIARNRIFYNVGSNIFSVDLEGKDMQLVCTAETNDLLGFTLVGDMIVYMSGTETFYVRTSVPHHTALSKHLNVYTCVTDGEIAFFCGASGGIYSMELSNGSITKVSDYTASALAMNGGYLYLMPAEAKDYVGVAENFIIKGGIYKFKISDLIASDLASSNHSEVSSSLSQNEASSTIAKPEKAPLSPELFGK